jgi:hypothetical protein
LTVCNDHYTEKKGQKCQDYIILNPYHESNQLNTRITVLDKQSLRKQKISLLVQNLTINYNFPRGPCPEPEYFSIHCDIAFLEIHKLHCYRNKGLLNGLFLSDFPTNMLLHLTSSHLSLLDLITLIIFYNMYKL